MMACGGKRIPAFILAGLLAGCNSVSSNYTGEITRASPARIFVCSGFDCNYKTRLDLGEAENDRFARIMAGGESSPEAERAAVAKAVSYYEELGATAIGARDHAKSDITQSRVKGQMDCIDESTNTRSLLRYLAARGMLRHHRVERNVSRGFLLDGRYPHSTAVLRDPQGRRWAIDSWYEPTGGAPDVMPLDEWMTRGVFGKR